MSGWVVDVELSPAGDAVSRGGRAVRSIESGMLIFAGTVMRAALTTLDVGRPE